MKELLIIVEVAGLLFMLFVGALTWGVLRKAKRIKHLAFVLFIAFLGSVAWAGFRLATKSYHKLAALGEPRTGDEIYRALFGQQKAACVQVINYQDQVIPKIDYAIWLQFKTCPQELARITKLHRFRVQKQATAGWTVAGPAADKNWFKPEILGDSVLVFLYKRDNYGSGQTLYASADSTRVFCVDFAE
ncbi:hypothetical protein [Hymenobacter sp. BT559]|uniref:hypothetical protein n=1 Tax=Hymenobacter sp. BT559 TaxID=2795729 RepID=UPI0018EB5AC2|nr:hypothetical protein [Hymenobacter sp. BT559]MBJ6144703.1 hypothetical protein [Hymenobacter sp. BT559]